MHGVLHGTSGTMTKGYPHRECHLRQWELMMYLLHWTQQSLLLALLTEWVLGGVAVTDMFPFPSIFTAYTVILLVASVLLLFMLLTKTPLGQLRASGKGTRPLWFP